MSPIAIGLSVLGLVPFILCGLAALGHNPAAADRWLLVLIDYAALTLSFVGAVHWGLALADATKPNATQRMQFVLGVVPLCGAWAALMLPAWAGLLLLIGCFVLAVVIERQALQRGLLPLWYWWLRLAFTAVGVAMLTTVVTLRLLGQTIAF